MDYRADALLQFSLSLLQRLLQLCGLKASLTQLCLRFPADRVHFGGFFLCSGNRVHFGFVFYVVEIQHLELVCYIVEIVSFGFVF